MDREGQLPRQLAAVAIGAIAVPLDVPISARDDGEAFGIGNDSQPQRLREASHMLKGRLL
jgi:hypothetical protein